MTDARLLPTEDVDLLAVYNQTFDGTCISCAESNWRDDHPDEPMSWFSMKVMLHPAIGREEFVSRLRRLAQVVERYNGFFLEDPRDSGNPERLECVETLRFDLN